MAKAVDVEHLMHVEADGALGLDYDYRFFASGARVNRHIDHRDHTSEVCRVDGYTRSSDATKRRRGAVMSRLGPCYGRGVVALGGRDGIGVHHHTEPAKYFGVRDVHGVVAGHVEVVEQQVRRVLAE